MKHSGQDLGSTAARCKEIQAQLQGYHCGEGSPLARLRISQHLDHCPACQALWQLQSTLAQSAQRGPIAWDDARKDSILAAVHSQITPRSALIKKDKKSVKLYIWQYLQGPALATALGVLVAFIALKYLPYPQVQGWLSAGPGVEAFATQGSRVHFRQGPAGQPQLWLDSGAVLVRYTRPRGGAPLELYCDQTQVIVRGTVFYVAKSGQVTQVGVRRGKVEVRKAGAELGLVKTDQSLKVSGDKTLYGPAQGPLFDMLDQLYPRIVVEPVASAPKPSAPHQVRRRPRDRDAISREIADQQAGLRECYEHALKRDSSLAGRVVMELCVDGQGQVSQARVVADQLGSTEIVLCLERRAGGWRFHSQDAFGQTLRVPLVLTQRLNLAQDPSSAQ